MNNACDRSDGLNIKDGNFRNTWKSQLKVTNHNWQYLINKPMYKLISQILILIVLSVHFLFYFIRTEYKALHLRWAWTTKLMGSADLLRGQWLDLKPLNDTYCFSCLKITGRSQGREKKKKAQVTPIYCGKCGRGH